MKGRYYLVLAVLAVFVLGVVGIGRWLRPYNLDEERAAARAAGIPLTAAEFPQPAPPPSEDAMPVYNRLTALLNVRPLNFRPVELSGASNGEPPPTVKTANLRAFLTSRTDLASLVHDAAAKPHAYFKLDWSMAQLFPHFMRMRESAKWLRWESELLVRDGKYDEAVKNEGLILRIANHASEEPTTIAHLVSLAVEAIAMRGFKDILHEAGDKPGVAAAVQRDIVAYRSNRNLSRALKGETLMGVTMIRGLGRAGQPEQNGGSGAEASQDPLKSGWFVQPSEAVHLHWMRRLVAASAAPVERRQIETDKVQREFITAMGKGRKFHVTSPSFELTAMLEPVYTKIGERDLQADAKRRVTITAAGILAYRQRSGRFPTTLDDAVKPVPVNPYTGKPLSYRGEGTGFVVSATPDLSGLDAKAAEKLKSNLEFRYPATRRPSQTPQGRNLRARL